MMNETLSLIEKRRSHRAYEKTQLTQEALDALLKAAVESPSANNRQPWHFSVVQNQDLLGQINRELRTLALRKAENERSPRFGDESFDVFYHAPTVIFISAPEDNSWASIDCGIAVQNIALAAESIGLGSVILGLPRDAFTGSRAEEFKSALGFPKGDRFIIAISLGTPSDVKAAHPVREGKISFIR